MNLRLAAIPTMLLMFVAGGVRAERGQFDRAPENAADEAYIFTPAGFTQPGRAITLGEVGASRLRITLVDAETDKPTWCRVNVVGSDGNFYQPAANPLTPFSLTGRWPDTGSGNRVGKAPIRYFGRFFYTRGQIEVSVPPGAVRVEAWKGFEHRPTVLGTTVAAGDERELKLVIERSVRLEQHGYYSGDPHLHFPRTKETDDAPIFDLLAAEDIHYGVVMCYNETNAYSGSMSTLVMPQLLGLGRRSERSRDDYRIISGQEYRNGVYGHINLFLRDNLVLDGATIDPNHWPVFGVVGKETQEQGGFAVHAHGGYAQEIYADLVQRTTNAVELLQFGIYRGIGLDGWYHVLNAGFRFPAVGACDYPACRKLGDCRTYVELGDDRSCAAWLRGAAAGRSFITSGPLVLLDVDGRRPGDRLDRQGSGPHSVTARVRVRSEVAPVTHVQLIVSGEVVEELVVPAAAGTGQWLAIERQLSLSEPGWIAARAFSTAPSGSPDAEAHTNPVQFYVDGRAISRAADLDWLGQRLDELTAEQEQRKFAEQPRVVAYYRHSRELIEQIRRNGQLAPPAP